MRSPSSREVPPATFLGTARPIDGRRRKLIRQLVVTLVFFGFAEIVGTPIALAVAVGSFGIRDVRTALLLRKLDPNRLRGRTCSWSYLAYACWCVLVVVVPLMIFLAIMSDSKVSGTNAPFFDEFIALIQMMFGCTLLGTLASWVAVVLAIRRDVKLWIEPRFQLMTRWPPGTGRAWPPILHPRSNPARFFPLVIKVTAGFVVLMGFCFSILLFTNQTDGISLGFVDWCGYVLVLAPSVGLARFILSPRFWRSLERVAASTPGDCYPELMP